MKRGDIVLAVARGDYGKPRPAVIVQSDDLPLSIVPVEQALRLVLAPD